MALRDVVVVGASAGGVEALREFLARLPSDFPGTVLIVLHVPAGAPSLLPQILSRTSAVPVAHATTEQELSAGHVLVAPPDHHLVVHDDAVVLSRGPRENGHRPAVDVLFRSAATALGSRVIGVVLSGALDDGAAGSVAVKLRGGTVLAQDPDEALHPSMPRSAIAAGAVDEVLPLAGLARRLADLVGEEAPPASAATELMEKETAMAKLEPGAFEDADHPGRPSGWSCPDCNGTMFAIEEGGLQRFRCRVGHAWSAAGLAAQQSASLETALWVAFRTLEERAALTRELGRNAEERGHRLSAEHFLRQAEEATSSAGLLRDLIERLGSGNSAEAADDAAAAGPV